MGTLKRILIGLSAGAAVGMAGALLVAPAILSWWARPAVPTMCSCVEQVDWALSNLRQSQLFAGLAAAVAVAAVAELVRWRRSRRTASAAAGVVGP